MDGRGLLGGVLGGLAGGVLFGMMMTAMDMMGMVAGLVGSDQVAVGWVVHLVISVLFGLGYALLLGRIAGSYGAAVGLGAAYGVGAWVVGALLIMPLWMGMPPFMLGEPQLMSLVGHLLFGVVLGGVEQAARLRGAAVEARA